MSQKRDIVISTPSGTRRISSGRTLAIIASCALVLILVAPTFFSYLEQQRALRQAQDELHAVQTHNAELKEELELWNNEDYVKAQARGRLGYVVPGETLYVITGDEEGSAADRLQARTAELQKARREATPWYMTMWDSLNVTGNLDEDGNVDNPDNVPMFEQPGVGTSKSPQTGTPVPDKGATGVADANAKDASEGTQ
ncbi:MAG: septum formation initiator family protein [Actinomycetaceae bacterium]|nr:septum formation initiator family protein [Actinomycetaceae bacterium]